MIISELELSPAIQKLGFKLFSIQNAVGSRVTICNYGAIIQSLYTADQHGQLGNVVLGHDDLRQYLCDPFYLGAVVGPCANRIANAELPLESFVYSLDRNHGQHHLHGGKGGLNRKFWSTQTMLDPLGAASGLKLHCHSSDGEAGYPGKRYFEVVYRLNNSNELEIEYRANTDKTSVVNLSQHSYFNLANSNGGQLPNILEHRLQINAAAITVVDDELIPTGELMDVAGTAFDFRQPKPIGRDIHHSHPLLKLAKGYDHNWHITPSTQPGIGLLAKVWEPTSGRSLEVYSDQPGLQLYSGNYLRQPAGKTRPALYPHCGFCLETQHFPDAPHQPHFKSIELSANQEYRTRTVYRFAVE